MYGFSLAQGGGKNLIQCELECTGDELRFFQRQDEGRGEKNVIPTQAVNATLGGIGEHVFLESGLPDFFGDVFLFGEWFSGGFAFDELDSEEKAETANFADVWMSGEWGERFAKSSCDGFNSLEQVFFFQKIENGVSSGCRNGMGLVGETVLERS